ncbi:MAG: SLC13 family permease [Halanaerobiales bacterium]
MTRRAMNSLALLLLIVLLASIFSINIHAGTQNISGTELKSENDSFTIDMAVISTFVLVIIILFILEPIRLDLISLSIPVTLIILAPWTGISIEEALSGFSNEATITIIAMFILSAAIERSGAIQILIEKISSITGKSRSRQVGVISSISGLTAGVINNTPVVALFIPMVKELARRTRRSPSRLLIPLSFGAMMEGMLTLIGTHTNILASNISQRLIDQSFSVFQFTHIGFISMIVGIVYLVTVGEKLIPERIPAEEEITEEYEMGDYLTEVVIREDSPLIGKTINETFEQFEYDIDLVQLIRKGESFVEPLGNKYLQGNDHLIIRTDQSTLLQVLRDQSLQILPGINVTRQYLEHEEKQNQDQQKMIEIVIPNDSFMIGQTLSETNFVDRYNTSVLAVRRGKELTHTSLEDITFAPGDILLIVAEETTLTRLRKNRNFIVASELEEPDYRPSKMFTSLVIMAAVILLAVFNILPIVISALGGVLMMVLTGCLDPGEIYEAINWEIIFLLAGVIPLGIAPEKTGTASFLAHSLINFENYLPPLGILILFYILTVLLTNVISRDASIVFMLPIAVDTALQLSLNPFAFVLAVTFAAGCSFLTPVGNQVNLMVYGPGGYRFRDFMVAGGPLQLLFAILIPFLISIFFPL